MSVETGNEATMAGIFSMERERYRPGMRGV
jgi:hypothetical protein